MKVNFFIQFRQIILSKNCFSINISKHKYNLIIINYKKCNYLHNQIFK